jgi:hypothetical protein
MVGITNFAKSNPKTNPIVILARGNCSTFMTLKYMFSVRNDLFYVNYYATVFKKLIKAKKIIKFG